MSMAPGQPRPLGVVPPPPGVTVDLNKMEPQAEGFRVMTGILMGAATVFVVLRLYTRLFVIRGLGMEDCTSQGVNPTGHRSRGS